MWKCKKCNETVDDEFDSCWNCGTGKDGSPPQDSFNSAKDDPKKWAANTEESLLADSLGVQSPLSHDQASRADGPRSVMGRLRFIAGFIKVVWTIIGALFCGLIGAGFGRGAGFLFGGLIGGGLGYFIGYINAVFIDWLCEMLSLQEKTYHALRKSKSG